MFEIIIGFVVGVVAGSVATYFIVQYMLRKAYE